MQSLLEISKMETGLIQINKKKLPLMDTVISAVNRTYPKADEKEIEFVFDYEKELETCTRSQPPLHKSQQRYTAHSSHQDGA